MMALLCTHIITKSSYTTNNRRILCHQRPGTAQIKDNKAVVLINRIRQELREHRQTDSHR